ncbi:MAG TPA: response regulator transcription factor [Patescibacteria group bacterium]|nr:response regulator transcription factor [Patescibacteria group bacterium]
MIIADDHVMFREGMRPFLERLAPEVEILEAGSLAEVMGHLGTGGAVGLVVLDLKMPGMVGSAGIRKIKDAHPPVPIVILSAVVDRLQVVESINSGASGFIPKRLSGAAMLSALQLVLAGERFVPYLALATDDEDGGGETPMPKHSANLSMLTRREKEILTLLKDGLSNKTIAGRLTVSEVTVKSHLCSIFRKMGVQNRVQAIRCFLGGDL